MDIALSPRVMPRSAANPPARPSADLSPPCSTLLIPLVARALGDALFPNVAVNDAHAGRTLDGLGLAHSHFLRDKLSIYGVLSRTRTFRALAQDFFEQHPQGVGVNLGCGLAWYFQWLDHGHNQWLDADLPEVMALRRQHLPHSSKRCRQAAVDLTEPDWWQHLALPEGPEAPPVLVLLEGVLMYLNAGQVDHLLREFALRAPPGSELLCDTLSWMAVGCAALHASVCHTHAEFRWGPRRLSEFTAPHPRLRLQSEHAVLEGYDWPTTLTCQNFRAFWGVPMYGITRLSLTH